jgi:hypothetical protein
MARPAHACSDARTSEGRKFMKSRRLPILAVVVTTAMLATLAGAAGAETGRDRSSVGKEGASQSHRTLPASGDVASRGPLKAYTATVDTATLQALVAGGYDVTVTEQSRRGSKVMLVLSAGERRALRGQGISTTFVSDGQESESSRFSTASESAFGWEVFRSYDEPGGIEDQLREIGSNPQYRGFVKLYDIGDTIQGRDILASA